MKKTFTAPDFGKITNIEFEGSAYLRGGIAEGALTYTVNGETKTITGEFYVGKDGYLIEEVFPTGNEEDGVVEIRIPVDVDRSEEKECIYIVITSSCVGQHNLHHLSPAYLKETESFASKSLDEAMSVYEKEVAWLKSEAMPADWGFVEQDPRSAVYCELYRMIDGKPDTLECIERSEYFYIPE